MWCLYVQGSGSPTITLLISVTTQKTRILNISTVETSNLALNFHIRFYDHNERNKNGCQQAQRDDDAKI